MAAYLYGTELPDNNNASVVGHIGDTIKHHVYFWANGSLQDDVAADRAAEEYLAALSLLDAGNFSGAALTAGIMSHYIDAGDKETYNEICKPIFIEGYKVVLDFIEKAKLLLDVEVTAVRLPEVDLAKAKAVADGIGVLFAVREHIPCFY